MTDAERAELRGRGGGGNEYSAWTQRSGSRLVRSLLGEKHRPVSAGTAVSAWRYPPSPERELQRYPKHAWLGWRPLPSPEFATVAPEFDDEDEVQAIITRAVSGHGFAAGDLVKPSSGDGYQAFVGRHGDYQWDRDYRELNDVERAKVLRSRERFAEQVARSQQTWEIERRNRLREQQAQSDAEWEAAAAQRKAERKAKAAERARERKEYNAWYNSPEQVAKRERSAARALAQEELQRANRARQFAAYAALEDERRQVEAALNALWPAEPLYIVNVATSGEIQGVRLAAGRQYRLPRSAAVIICGAPPP